jgi:TRAP-type C4-dicarboxylate transport system permease small subunit
MPPILRRLAAWFAMAAGLAGCATALLTTISVLSRALLGRPIQGDVELTQFGIAICIALCLPWAQLRGANIIVDFFTQRTEERTQRRMDAVGTVLLALMAGVLAWRTLAGALAVGSAQETTMILGLPMWWTYAALAPGLALTVVIALVQTWRRWHGMPTHEAAA